MTTPRTATRPANGATPLAVAPADDPDSKPMAERHRETIQRLTGGDHKPLLLLVDDQPANIQTLHQILQADYEVLVATSGARALAVCRQSAPNLILLDVVMPEMDGYETFRRLRSDAATRDIPVIFVTAHDSPDDEARGLEAGAVDFISKPPNPVVVRARVKTHLLLKDQSDLLRDLAYIDGLTGIANRRTFDEQLDLDWRACRRNGSELAILMIDVDHFKAYNDHYGHQAGDDCLRRIADVLRQQLHRAYDFVARYGGEEFVCLLPGTGMAGAAAKGRSLLRAVRDLELPHESSPNGQIVTVSLGVAGALPSADSTADQLVADADAQLYRAKKEGRNRIAVQQQPVPARRPRRSPQAPDPAPILRHRPGLGGRTRRASA